MSQQSFKATIGQKAPIARMFAVVALAAAAAQVGARAQQKVGDESSLFFFSFKD